jgi:glycine hydroxymethyltransferase
LPQYYLRKTYCEQIIKNAKTLEIELKKYGFNIVTGGTDNHLLLIDTYNSKGVTGKECETLLDKVGITVNKNSIPNDTLPPMTTSGIRIGTPAITTRGMKEEEMVLIAKFINDALINKEDEVRLEEIHNQVKELTKRFPLN